VKCLVRSPLSPYSGYGNDGIGIVRALLRMGLDVYLDSGYYSPPLPDEVAALLTRRLEAPFDLLIHHVDPGQLGITPETRNACAATVAHTMWEYTTLDNLKNRRGLKKRLRDYDLVLGYDSVSTGALAPYVTGAADTLQGGFWPDQWPAVRRDWNSKRFGFCMVGVLSERKDPFVAIQAFKELKDEYPDEFDGAELHLKTNVPGLHSAMEEWVPKLRVHYAVWPEHVLRDFYAGQHCLISPSRGEGKNMPALEFLSTGGTVIATNWGGHQQWLSDAYAYPLDYTLAPQAASTPDCLNARASKDDLKKLMLHVYRNRDEARRKGELAADLIPDMCGWDSVMERLFTKIGDRTKRGHLLSEARMSREKLRTTQGFVHA
jgi:glycosyltransferase involved in cell wall biosynthesis